MRENVRFILLKKKIINFVCNGAMLLLALPFSVLITDDFSPIINTYASGTHSVSLTVAATINRICL